MKPCQRTVTAAVIYGFICATVFVGTPALGEEDAFIEAYRTALPFEMPSTDELRQSKKKVFAHWHNFSQAYDNLPEGEDHWSKNIFSLEGSFKPDQDKFANSKIGGFTREKPIPRAPLAGDDWAVQDAMVETRYAIGAGLDGFYFNILGVPGTAQFDKVESHLEAAERVDPGFRIMPAVDAAGVTTPDKAPQAVDTFYQMLMGVKDHSSILRTEDERMVFGCFFAQHLMPDNWYELRKRLQDSGVGTFFIPVFLGFRSNPQKYSDYAPIADGMGDWGPKHYTGAIELKELVNDVHAMGELCLFPVAPQQLRSKSSWYNESANSQLYRETWEMAIKTNADWVQIVTWNDYGEGTEIVPSTGIQYAFLDLTAYYTAWFKTGKQPKIVRDALYYFHRVHSDKAPAKEGIKPVTVRGSDSKDDIEMVAFLTEPGELGIEVGGKKQTMKAAAGMTSFRVPLREGRPVFTLTRDGKEVIRLESAFEIKNDGLIFQNFLYYAGSSNRQPVPGVDSYKMYYRK